MQVIYTENGKKYSGTQWRNILFKKESQKCTNCHIIEKTGLNMGTVHTVLS